MHASHGKTWLATRRETMMSGEKVKELSSACVLLSIAPPIHSDVCVLKLFEVVQLKTQKFVSYDHISIVNLTISLIIGHA